MNHHTKEYLLANIKVQHHFLNTKEGIVILYELEDKTFFMIADPERLTLLLLDCHLIDDRRQSSNGWYVKTGGEWLLFKYYLPSYYSESELLLLCVEHESRKIIENVNGRGWVSRLSPLCFN